MLINKFDDIRPYYEEEIAAAMRRIGTSSIFPTLASFVFPDEDVDDVRKRLISLKTIREFQIEMMYPTNKQIIRRTINTFSCNGLDMLDTDKSYLYISNHRDIMLDASLLQNSLVDNGFDTTEITFGANLMQHDTIVDIGKSNKMFRVDRPSDNIKDFYIASKHLSAYIRYTITQKHQSVWIAQRNGRTKDGIDATDQGIIKMLGMSSQEEKVQDLYNLHIVPISVSYEWEPCDIFKAVELYVSSAHKYIKKPGEDLTSILTGITQYKGNVHFEVCEPLKFDEIVHFKDLNGCNFNKAVSSLIDKRINKAYQLFPNNYIAHDMLHGNEKYKCHYSKEEFDLFIKHLSALEQFSDFDTDKLKDIFLSIYSNPIENRYKYE